MSDTKPIKQGKLSVDDEMKNMRVEVETMKKELEEAKKISEEYKTKYLRALADYQNFEKRVADQKAELITSANRELITKLLSFLDNLEKAEIFIKDTSLKMIKDSFYAALQSTGLKEIEVVGKEYDPYNAEVIDMVEGERDNMVTEVLRKGYELNGRIIRIAQVKVSRKTTKSN